MDRRRINGPAGGTQPPLFTTYLDKADTTQRPIRTRQPDQLRKIFLKTGLTPSASGSSYLELEPPSTPPRTSLISPRSSLKLTCAVHGPRPLPRSAPFSPQLLLSTHIKYAPFAARRRRGYLRDAGERDLGVHLEAALRGVIIGERWPKSGVEVVITVLEAEDDMWWGDEVGLGEGTGHRGVGGCGMMTVLAGCITAASAALVEAGIDCVDLVAGGVAALVRPPRKISNGAHSIMEEEEEARAPELVLDPCPAEHGEIVAAAVVGYLGSRDELTEIWMKGDIGDYQEQLLERAVDGAKASRTVLAEAVKESAEVRLLGVSANGTIDNGQSKKDKAPPSDIQMSG